MNTFRFVGLVALTLVTTAVSAAAAPVVAVLSPTLPKGLSTSIVIGPSINRDHSQNGEQSASFQPDLFNPGKTAATYNRTTDLWKVVSGGQTYYYRKNNRRWYEPQGRTLISPYSLDHYSFQWYNDALGENSYVDTSYVLEVKKDGRRHALYTHVLNDWAISPDGAALAMQSYVKKDGNWQLQHRLIDIASKKTALLPIDGCGQGTGEWEGDLLLTQGDQQACFWKKDGTLVYRLDMKEGLNSISPIGSPASALILVPATSDPSTDCRLVLLKTDGSEKPVLRSAPDPVCAIYANVEFNTSAFTWKKPNIRYRVSSFIDGPTGGSYGPFSAWKTLP